ncbi:MAG: agmatinase [Thermosediminibacterales bacterium]|nr:agmatinase [Thermosediminibacterales bacterium]
MFCSPKICAGTIKITKTGELKYMLKKFICCKKGFMGCSDSYKDSKVVIIGAPMDLTVSFRPGARMGPSKIREVSYGLEEFSMYSMDSLNNKSYYDAGDLELPLGNVIESMKTIKEASNCILENGKIPFFIGGEHLISLPVIEAVSQKYKDLVVIHFDAHADLRKDFMGEKYSHATVMRRVAELIGGKNIYQFGIRSGTEDELRYARENTNFYPFSFTGHIKEVFKGLKQRPAYISLDIDVVDPAYAPGTGTPEPGGCTAAEILEVTLLLGDLNIVGMDLVEVSPMFDLSERTSLLAAKVIREMLIRMG